MARRLTSAWTSKETLSRSNASQTLQNQELKMSKTISRLYNGHAEARAAVRELEAAGVSHGKISILVSNADSAYDEKTKSFPDRDLDGRDDRAEGARAGGGGGGGGGGDAG